MSKDTQAALVRMANQIGRNFIAIGHDKAVLATADHIERYWDLRMKHAILAGDRSGLEPVAAQAVERLGAQMSSADLRKHGGLHNSDVGQV